MQLSALLATLSVLGATVVSATATLPPVDKIRGVNLGGWLVSEPWMMTQEWNRMGCGGQKSEFDCMSQVSNAQAGFTSHFKNWITQSDFQTMASYGLNTVRIPLGYWIVESTVDAASEHFPKGGFAYLKQACGWAKAAGLNVILDMHGYNYDRAYAFFKNLTTEIHSNPNQFGSVFALEAVNEPFMSTSSVGNMLSVYYPGVLSAVRNAESALGVSCSSGTRRASRIESRASFTGCLNVQYMDSRWGSGDARTSLPAGAKNIAYDSHQYVKYTGTAPNRNAYMAFSCKDHPENQPDSPVITGEWSMSTEGDNQYAELSTTASDAATFFNKWGSAQMMAYERGSGWIFWKTDTLNDPRWDYQLAVSRGYITTPAASWNQNACSGYATS
ncbi:hypothetical protein RQP46_004128 [Phenoliferia psychrophenolica]